MKEVENGLPSEDPVLLEGSLSGSTGSQERLLVSLSGYRGLGNPKA